MNKIEENLDVIHLNLPKSERGLLPFQPVPKATVDAGAVLVRLRVGREVLAHLAVPREDIEATGEVGVGGQGTGDSGSSHSSSLLSAVGRNPL